MYSTTYDLYRSQKRPCLFEVDICVLCVDFFLDDQKILAMRDSVGHIQEK